MTLLTTDVCFLQTLSSTSFAICSRLHITRQRWRLVKEHATIWKFGNFSHSVTQRGYAWGTWRGTPVWAFHKGEIHWTLLRTTWPVYQTPRVSNTSAYLWSLSDSRLHDSIFILLSRPRDCACLLTVGHTRRTLWSICPCSCRGKEQESVVIPITLFNISSEGWY